MRSPAAGGVRQFTSPATARVSRLQRKPTALAARIREDAKKRQQDVDAAAEATEAAEPKISGKNAKWKADKLAEQKRLTEQLQLPPVVRSAIDESAEMHRWRASAWNVIIRTLEPPNNLPTSEEARRVVGFYQPRRWDPWEVLARRPPAAPKSRAEAVRRMKLYRTGNYDPEKDPIDMTAWEGYTYDDIFAQLSKVFSYLSLDPETIYDKNHKPNKADLSSNLSLGNNANGRLINRSPTRGQESVISSTVAPGKYYFFLHDPAKCTLGGPNADHRPFHNRACCTYFPLVPRPTIPIPNHAPFSDTSETSQRTMVKRRDGRCVVTGGTYNFPNIGMMLGPLQASHVVPRGNPEEMTEEIQLSIAANRFRLSGGTGSGPTNLELITPLGRSFVPNGIGVNAVENAITLRGDIHSVFDQFLWSVLPGRRRLVPFAPMGKYLEKYAGVCLDENSDFPEWLPPDKVFRWHYDMCWAKMLLANVTPENLPKIKSVPPTKAKPPAITEDIFDDVAKDMRGIEELDEDQEDVDSEDRILGNFEQVDEEIEAEVLPEEFEEDENTEQIEASIELPEREEMYERETGARPFTEEWVAAIAAAFGSGDCGFPPVNYDSGVPEGVDPLGQEMFNLDVLTLRKNFEFLKKATDLVNDPDQISKTDEPAVYGLPKRHMDITLPYRKPDKEARRLGVDTDRIALSQNMASIRDVFENLVPWIDELYRVSQEDSNRDEFEKLLRTDLPSVWTRSLEDDIFKIFQRLGKDQTSFKMHVVGKLRDPRTRENVVDAEKRLLPAEMDLARVEAGFKNWIAFGASTFAITKRILERQKPFVKPMDKDQEVPEEEEEEDVLHLKDDVELDESDQARAEDESGRKDDVGRMANLLLSVQNERYGLHRVQSSYIQPNGDKEATELSKGAQKLLSHITTRDARLLKVANLMMGLINGMESEEPVDSPGNLESIAAESRRGSWIKLIDLLNQDIGRLELDIKFLKTRGDQFQSMPKTGEVISKLKKNESRTMQLEKKRSSTQFIRNRVAEIRSRRGAKPDVEAAQEGGDAESTDRAFRMLLTSTDEEILPASELDAFRSATTTYDLSPINDARATLEGEIARLEKKIEMAKNGSPGAKSSSFEAPGHLLSKKTRLSKAQEGLSRVFYFFQTLPLRWTSRAPTGESRYPGVVQGMIEYHANRLMTTQLYPLLNHEISSLETQIATMQRELKEAGPPDSAPVEFSEVLPRAISNSQEELQRLKSVLKSVQQGQKRILARYVPSGDPNLSRLEITSASASQPNAEEEESQTPPHRDYLKDALKKKKRRAHRQQMGIRKVAYLLSGDLVNPKGSDGSKDDLRAQLALRRDNAKAVIRETTRTLVLLRLLATFSGGENGPEYEEKVEVYSIPLRILHRELQKTAAKRKEEGDTVELETRNRVLLLAICLLDCQVKSLKKIRYNKGVGLEERFDQVTMTRLSRLEVELEQDNTPYPVERESEVIAILETYLANQEMVREDLAVLLSSAESFDLSNRLSAEFRAEVPSVESPAEPARITYHDFLISRVDLYTQMVKIDDTDIAEGQNTPEKVELLRDDKSMMLFLANRRITELDYLDRFNPFLAPSSSGTDEGIELASSNRPSATSPFSDASPAEAWEATAAILNEVMGETSQVGEWSVVEDQEDAEFKAIIKQRVAKLAETIAERQALSLRNLEHGIPSTFVEITAKDLDGSHAAISSRTEDQYSGPEAAAFTLGQRDRVLGILNSYLADESLVARDLAFFEPFSLEHSSDDLESEDAFTKDIEADDMDNEEGQVGILEEDETIDVKAISTHLEDISEEPYVYSEQESASDQVTDGKGHESVADMRQNEEDLAMWLEARNVFQKEIDFYEKMIKTLMNQSASQPRFDTGIFGEISDLSKHNQRTKSSLAAQDEVVNAMNSLLLLPDGSPIGQNQVTVELKKKVQKASNAIGNYMAAIGDKNHPHLQESMEVFRALLKRVRAFQARRSNLITDPILQDMAKSESKASPQIGKQQTSRSGVLDGKGGPDWRKFENSYMSWLNNIHRSSVSTGSSIREGDDVIGGSQLVQEQHLFRRQKPHDSQAAEREQLLHRRVTVTKDYLDRFAAISRTFTSVQKTASNLESWQRIHSILLKAALDSSHGSNIQSMTVAEKRRLSVINLSITVVGQQVRSMMRTDPKFYFRDLEPFDLVLQVKPSDVITAFTPQEEEWVLRNLNEYLSDSPRVSADLESFASRVGGLVGTMTFRFVPPSNMGSSESLIPASRLRLLPDAGPSPLTPEAVESDTVGISASQTEALPDHRDSTEAGISEPVKPTSSPMGKSIAQLFDLPVWKFATKATSRSAFKDYGVKLIGEQNGDQAIASPSKPEASQEPLPASNIHRKRSIQSIINLYGGSPDATKFSDGDKAAEAEGSDLPTFDEMMQVSAMLEDAEPALGDKVEHDGPKDETEPEVPTGNLSLVSEDMEVVADDEIIATEEKPEEEPEVQAPTGYLSLGPLFRTKRPEPVETPEVDEIKDVPNDIPPESQSEPPVSDELLEIEAVDLVKDDEVVSDDGPDTEAMMMPMGAEDHHAAPATEQEPIGITDIELVAPNLDLQSAEQEEIQIEPFHPETTTLQTTPTDTHTQEPKLAEALIITEDKPAEETISTKDEPEEDPLVTGDRLAEEPVATNEEPPISLPKADLQIESQSKATPASEPPEALSPLISPLSPDEGKSKEEENRPTAAENQEEKDKTTPSESKGLFGSLWGDLWGRKS